MLLAAIVGDIVGSPYEFNNIKTADFPLFSETSRYTDDSVMTLAVASALMRAADERIPLSYALVDSLQSFGAAYDDAGYGGRFNRWLRERDQPRPYDSWGNGSAMRVSPVAWAFESIELVEFVAAETAKITHNHVEGIRGAQATAACIYLARNGATNAEIKDRICGRYGYSLDFTLDSIRATYRFDVSCQGTVPQAIVAFLESNDFEDAIRLAVSIGGDSDTLAAITASIAQGRYGLPQQLEQKARTYLPSCLLDVNDCFWESVRR